MTTSSRSFAQERDDVPRVFRRSRIALLALTTGFGFTAAGCHETDPGQATTAIRPMGALSRAASISGADSLWDTYSAVVTIHSEGTQFKNSVAKDASFHLTRTLQADSTWRTTIDVMPKQNSLTGKVSDPARRLGRIEIGAEGIKSYDGLGKEIVRHGPSLDNQAAAAHARHPERGPFPLMEPTNAGTSRPSASHPHDGQAWADGVFAGPAAGDRARVRYARLFGSEAERIGSQYRYVRTNGDRRIEVLVDSLTGVPMEVRDTRGGTLAVHVVHAYDHRPDGSNILRETRVERPAAAGEGLAILVTRFDSVTFSRGGAGR